MPAPWPELSLEADPRLVVGFRKGSGLIDCHRVQIHEDTFHEFRQIATEAISRISNLTRRPYDYFGALEEDEFFALANSDIPIPSQQTPGSEETASALRIVAQTDQHPLLPPDRLRTGMKLNLYMISFPTPSGFLGFIRQTGPQRSIKPGIRYFQYGDTLKRVRHPDLVIDDKIDLIVGPDEVAIFSERVVQVLFRDVRLVMGSVDGNIDRISEKHHQRLPLSIGGREALRRYGNKGPRNARRLDDLAQYRITELKDDPAAVMQDLANHKLDYLIVDGEIVLTTESIPQYLDYLEGRLYHDDHTNAPRRADRFSRR